MRFSFTKLQELLKVCNTELIVKKSHGGSCQPEIQQPAEDKRKPLETWRFPRTSIVPRWNELSSGIRFWIPWVSLKPSTCKWTGCTWHDPPLNSCCRQTALTKVFLHFAGVLEMYYFLFLRTMKLLMEVSHVTNMFTSDKKSVQRMPGMMVLREIHKNPQENLSRQIFTSHRTNKQQIMILLHSVTVFAQ